MSIHQINKKYEDSNFKQWYIKKNMDIEKYGIQVSEENDFLCNITFVDENGKKLLFSNISRYEAVNSIIVFAYDDNKQKYYELINNSTFSNPISLQLLKNMILIINTQNGMYVTFKNNTSFYNDSKFFKLSNDGTRLQAKKFNKHTNTKEFEDYPVDGKGLYIEKNYDNFDFDKNHFSIRYCVSKDLSSQISTFYFKRYNPKLLNNIFDDDESLNYEIAFNNVDDYTLGEINFFKQKTNNYSIYGITVSSLVNAVLNTCNFQDSYFESEESRKRFRNSCIKIFEDLKQKFSLNDREMLQYLYINYIKKENTNYNHINNIIKQKNISFEKYGQKWKNEYKKIHMYLIEKNFLNIKWKSEVQLFNTVKSIYDDTIYQYRDKWLNNQSLDIFIPSLRIGIEYQGKQHYEPVEIFGGIEHFKKQQALDYKKKLLCKSNDVKLIEWKYDIPITKPNVKMAINELSK